MIVYMSDICNQFFNFFNLFILLQSSILREYAGSASSRLVVNQKLNITFKLDD